MADALDILNNLKALDIDGIINETLVENERYMADLNATQLSEGLRSDGHDIIPEYAKLTIQIKEGKSGLAGVTDHVTLFDTGDFYDAMYAEVQGAEIEFGSKDEKSKKLQEKYTDKIYGLDDTSKTVLGRREVAPIV
jgi:hypothetical protein